MRGGFCVTSDGPVVRFHLLGGPPMRRLLAFHQAPDGAALLVGRLHYREDLSRALGVTAAPRATANDGGLVLAAYRRWGRQGLERLEGCFAAVVWDANERRLYARRDLLGGFPLFWAQRGHRFAAGTHLPSVCSWVGATRMDPEYQADYLMLPTCGVHEPASERTPYEGVQRLGPRAVLDAELAAGRVRVAEHWDWLDRIEEPTSSAPGAIAERFLELLRGAVRQRMVGRTAAHVSGGMDSTAVALLALEETQRGAAAGPLHTISLVYDAMTVLAREREIIESVVCERPGVVAHLIAGDRLFDFAPYAAPPEHDEPWPWLGMAETELARADEAERAGVDTVLTGQGADDLLDLGPHHLADLLRRGRLLLAWREACASAHAENCGVWPILYPFGIRTLLPAWARDGLGPHLRGGRADWRNLGDYTLPPWIRPAYARRFRLWERAAACDALARRPRLPAPVTTVLERVARRTGDLGRWYITAPRGVLVEHPFLDPRLVRFLIGVHATTPPRPRTRPKPILVDATAGILPDSIRLRNKAGFFNEPYFRGIAAHAAALERLVSASAPAADAWLDPDALILCLRQSALGIGTDRCQMDRLNVTLSWLRWRSLAQGGASSADDLPISVHALTGATRGLALPAFGR